MPQPNRRPGAARPRWRLSSSSWLIVPAGIAAGVLLFAIVWLQREAVDTEAPAMLPPVEVDARAEPAALPAPQLPAELEPGDGEPAAGGVFSLPDAPPEPPPPAGATLPERPVAADPATPGTFEAAADSGPVPVHSPPPVYPGRSLRRGESGEVVVQVLVDRDGRPRQVEVARSSSHRALDQAAVRAVRGWRFQPAMRQGQPVAQVVQIPVAFSP